jgi:hypothetical protein
MAPAYERTTAGATDYIVVEPTTHPEFARNALRWAATSATLVLFGYCLRTGWDVLQGLGRVSLADVTHALRMVSVRDAILCTIGYRIGRELLVAALQTRRGR